MELTGAQIIAECLLEQRVDTVFGYPGGAVLNIYDALYEYRDRIRHVLTAHEQGAAHAADGYARSTGKAGVVIATSGPGATNLVTGIATAYMDSIPMVAITGNVAVELLGRDSFQEVDITGITMPVTKHNFVVKRVEDLAHVIRKAFQIAQSGRPGPVLIDVPKDVTANRCQYERREPLPLQPPPKAPREELEKAAQMLRASKRPFVYAGGGVIASGASQELLRFAEKLQAPVCTSLMGLGGFPEDHPLSLGMIGMHGSYAAGMALDHSDLIVVMGARFSDRVAGNREKFGEHGKILQLDVDLAEIDKNVLVDRYLIGDLKKTAAALNGLLEPQDHSQWLGQLEAWKQEAPRKKAVHGEAPDHTHILQTINSLLKPDDILVTDVGQHQMWAAQDYQFLKPRTFLTSGGLGTMGYGLGASIGAQSAHPGRRVVLVTGDGSFHMNLNELATLASYELPVMVVVMNNQVLGMVRQWQKLFYGGRFSQTDPHRKTNFEALARAFGVEGRTIREDSRVESALQEAFALKKPVVVDCRISPDDNVLPMIPPGGTVGQMITEMD